MASIRDVAKEAGVASCTVSRVLNGTAKVAPETQKKIEDAMKKLNYVPNELARGMFKGKSNTIAMLVPNIQHPWFSSLASAIERILYKQGYKLMLFSTDDKKDREKECFQTLKSNIVDGIICGTSTMSASEYKKVEKPMVMLDYKVGEHFPVIVSDHAMGAELAAKEFINSGCHYVIHISGNRRDKNIMSFQSHEVLDQKLKEAGIRSRRVEICWNDFDFSGYFELAKCILEEYPDVDGVMAADIPATAFLKAALAIGKKLPEDLAIVAYDGTFVTKTCTTQMTTICQPYEEIAQKAVEYLMKGLHQEMKIEQSPGEIILPVKLEKGITTK
ncbi:LacI family DNA-binding transcriptional regulator [Blautia sp. HCP3S3_H10_1]|uniref:LacI family DNA-binding transcriptional regulator n=1 Tax=unclassified Blautia TaxID=2648079 RepID=UPI003F8DD612